MEVISRGFRIHYEVYGSGPPLLLLHGGSQWAELWADCGYVEALRDGFRLITPDRLGHGESAKPHDPALHGAADVAADFVAVLDAVGVEDAHVWGYSAGAHSAVTLAVLHKDRVRSVVLGGGPWPSTLDDPAARAERYAPLIRALREPGVTPWYDGKWSPKSQSPLSVNDPLAVAASIEGSLTLLADWREIRAPMLFYLGDGDLTAEDENRLPGYEDARTYVLSDTSHVGGFIRSADVVPFVRAFLERVEGGEIGRF